MDKHLSQLERLLQIKQYQINSLLEVTQAINENYRSPALFRIYEFILRAQMGVGKIAVFIFDNNWLCISSSGTPYNENEVEFPAELLEFKEVTRLKGRKSKFLSEFDLVFPVYHKDVPLAFSLIGDLRPDTTDSMEENIKFIQTITNIIMVAIENKKLFRIQLEQIGLRKQLELAAQMQTMLIPHNTMLPNNSQMEMDAVYMPHTNIGGDYYDFIRLSEHEVVICIGDISGKGIPAALLMANFQANLRALIMQEHHIGKFMHLLNSKVYEITNGEQYITLFLACYNSSNRTLQYVNAGHNPSVLFMNGQLALLESGCTILGMFSTLPALQVGSVNLAPDALLVNYTDGLVEAENKENQFFEMEYLTQFICDNYQLPLSAFNTKLVDTIIQYQGSRSFNDDISILSCRFH